MEEHRAQNFLKELQSLDEPTKQKVLIISTIVVMIVILFVWVAYFNSIIIPSVAETGATTTAATQTGPPVATVSGPGFWKGIENSVANIFHGGSQTIKPTN